MDLHLKDKVIIVTGGAGCIGERIAQKLADEDAITCIVDRDEKAVAELFENIANKNKKCIPVVADLSDPGACKETVDKVLQEWGGIHGLVNNAGWNDKVGLEYGTCSNFMRSIKANAVPYYSMIHFAIDALKISKGRIVNICSKIAETGQGSTSGYAAANGVRYELTSLGAKELSPYDICVNAIVVAEGSCLPEELNRRRGRSPLNERMTTVDEIADTALFLLSPKAGPINGEFFYVDGGYVHLDRKV